VYCGIDERCPMSVFDDRGEIEWAFLVASNQVFLLGNGRETLPSPSVQIKSKTQPSKNSETKFIRIQIGADAAMRNQKQ
jgi:hypothetical protein